MLQKTFAEEGLQYSMGGDTGNTRNSHRLLAWAADAHGLDKQNQLAEALFNGYFCKVCSAQPTAYSVFASHELQPATGPSVCRLPSQQSMTAAGCPVDMCRCCCL